MKKIIYSLVIMIAAGSLFTSCIEQIEPVGILDMRTAKAEYIRALKDLRAADAEYTRALAAVEQANAAYRMAETAWMQEQVNNQKLLNEYQELLNEAQATENEVLAAEAALKIQKLGQLMEESALKHEATMIELQYKVEKANYEYDMAMRDLAILAKNLSPEERLAVVEAAAIYGAMNELYADSAKKLNAWQARYDKLAEELKNYNYEKWDGEAMVNKVVYYEEKIAEEKENIKEYQDALDAIPEKDADIEAWAAAVEAYDAKIDQLKQAKAQNDYDWQVFEDGIAANLRDMNKKIGDFVEENWTEKPAGTFTEPQAPTKAEYTTNANPAENSSFVPSEPASAAFVKFKYLLNSYMQPSPANWKKDIVKVSNDTMYVTANLAIADFVLGAAGDTAVIVSPKVKSAAGNDTTIKAYYGLLGAVDVLKRDKVLNSAEKDTTLEKTRDEAKALWESDRDTLLKGLKAYKPYVDALKEYKEAQEEESEGAKSMVAAIKTLEEAFGSINSNDLSKNDSIRILNAFVDFAKARKDYLDYTYDKKAQAKDSNMFRFTKGVNASGAIADSVDFTALNYETLLKGGYNYEYNTTDSDTNLDHYLYANPTTEPGVAFANIAEQLFGDVIAGLLISEDPKDWAGSIVTESNLNNGTGKKVAFYNLYYYDEAKKVMRNVSDDEVAESKALKAAKEEVVAAAADFVAVYDRFWGIDPTPTVTPDYTAYFAETDATKKADELKKAEKAINDALTLQADAYTAATFMTPTNIVAFAGADVLWTNAMGAVLGTVEYAAQGIDKSTAGDEFEASGKVVPTSVVFNNNGTDFYAYMKAEWDYQQSLIDNPAAIAEIEEWVNGFASKVAADKETAGKFDEEGYNKAKKEFDEGYAAKKKAFVGSGKNAVVLVKTNAKHQWIPEQKTSDFLIGEPKDIESFFETDAEGMILGWDETKLGGTQFTLVKGVYGEDAPEVYAAHTIANADLDQEIAFATAEKEKAEAVFVAAVKVKNLKDKDGNVIGGATMKEAQEAYDKAYEGFVKFYEGEIEKSEKAIADYQKAIVNFQNGLTDLETEFQNVSDKLETAKAEMGVLAEGLALAKSNYEAIMNYIKTESEGTLIIPVTLNEVMKVVENLDLAGIDVSSLLSTVAGAVTSLL